MASVKQNRKETLSAPVAHETSEPKRRLTGLYLALLVAGFMLIGQALEAFLMWKLQARLGLALLTTAVIIGAAKDRVIPAIALIILWGGFLMTVLH